MRVASYVARDNVRHQAPKAPLTLSAVVGQLRQRAVRPLPLQIKSGARTPHYAAKWMAISGFLPSIAQCFCVSVSLGQTGAG